MADCKNCIHKEVCDIFCQIDTESKSLCSLFKSKNKFIELTQDEISEFRHYLNSVKNSQSLDVEVRKAVAKLLHKFPNNDYVRKPGQEEK